MEIITGGIYYFSSRLQFTKSPVLKILVYICCINDSPVFAKISTESYCSKDEVDIYKTNYPTNPTIMYDSYLNCGELIRNNINKSDFLCLPDNCYRGMLTFSDLQKAKERFRFARTLSSNEKSIIIAAIDNQLDSLSKEILF